MQVWAKWKLQLLPDFFVNLVYHVSLFWLHGEVSLWCSFWLHGGVFMGGVRFGFMGECLFVMQTAAQVLKPAFVYHRGICDAELQAVPGAGASKHYLFVMQTAAQVLKPAFV